MGDSLISLKFIQGVFCLPNTGEKVSSAQKVMFPFKPKNKNIKLSALGRKNGINEKVE